MIHRTTFPAALAVLALLAGACGNGDASNLRVSRHRIDFGRILWGDIARDTVVLENRGERDITVTHTSFNCKCFKLRPFLRTLHPGESRELEVSFVSALVGPGPIRGKELHIVSDDPETERVRIDLLGDIVQSMTLVPPVVDLGPLSEPESRADHVVKLRPGPDMELELLRWHVQPAGAFEARTEEAEGGTDFHLRLTKPPPRSGNMFVGSLEVRVRVEGAGFPAREIEHVLRIQGPW